MRRRFPARPLLACIAAVAVALVAVPAAAQAQVVVVDGCGATLAGPPAEYSFTCTGSGVNASGLAFADWGAASTSSAATISTAIVGASGAMQPVSYAGAVTFRELRRCTDGRGYYAAADWSFTVPAGGPGEPGTRSSAETLSTPDGCTPAPNPAQRAAGCKSAVVYRGNGVRYRATGIKRTPRISCRLARNLLRAAYRQGPLKITRTVSGPGGTGRPTYWIKGGWRCTNGAGGATCWHAKKRRYNTVAAWDGELTLAVSAAVDLD